MSDLLALTGWIGEHPRTGADVAHLLAFPATGFDVHSHDKMAALAEVWGLGGMDETPMADVSVTLDPARLHTSGGDWDIPAEPEWETAARDQRIVIVSLTSTPLAAPGIEDVEVVITEAIAGQEEWWSGIARTT